MNKYHLIKQLSKQHADVLFPGMSVATLLAALQLQKEIPAMPYEWNHQFPNLWEEHGLPIAQVEAKKLARTVMADAPHVVELARLVYQHRCKHWTDPVYVIANCLEYWKIFQSIDGLTEQDDYKVWSHLLEYTSKNNEIFRGLIFGKKNITPAKTSVVQSIMDSIEDAYPTIGAGRLRAMREAVRATVERTANFMQTNADGFTIGDQTSYDYLCCVLEVYGLHGHHAERAKQILLGYSEQEDWWDIIEKMFNEEYGNSIYIDEAGEYSPAAPIATKEG